MKKVILIAAALGFSGAAHADVTRVTTQQGNGTFPYEGIQRVCTNTCHVFHFYTDPNNPNTRTTFFGENGASFGATLEAALNDFGDGNADYAYADAAAAMAATSDRTITVADLNAAPIGATVNYNSRTYEKRMAGNQIAWYSHVSGTHYTTATVDAIAQGASNLSSLNASRYKDEDNSYSPDFTGTIPDAPTVTGSFYLNAEFAGGEQRGFFARDFPVGTHIRWGPNASYEATVAIVNGQKTWQGSASARTGFNTSTRLYANIPTGNDAPGANPNWRTANPGPIHIPANTTWSTDYPVGTTLTLSGSRTWDHGIRTATLELVDGRKQWRVRFGNGQVAGIPGSSTAASTIDPPWGAYRHNWQGVIDISSGVNPTGGFANVSEDGSADNYNIDRDNENYRRIFHYEKDGVAAGGFNVLRDYLNANNVYYDRFRFAIAEAYEDGFEEGYEDGWEEGYEDGYELGYQHGFADARETN